jgi:diguanylate cyclase (GGDEF)-like protein
MDPSLALLPAMVEALDSLGVAVCAFDEADAALLWNRSFLRFFPEHAADIHVGEPYVTNLRRFYRGRLDAKEMPFIERYVEEGLARHRAQQRPFSFEHRGVRLQVASLPLPGIGRIRIWKSQEDRPPEATVRDASPAIDGSTLFDHVADGVMVTDAAHRILWVNEPFVAMYRLNGRAAAVGLSFEDAYRAAWHGPRPEDRPLFERGLSILADNLRFAGAPFEVPLPQDRWCRVIAQWGPEGRGFFAHVDITVLKRQQHQLRMAEARARASEAELIRKSMLLEATLDRMEQGIMMVNAEQIVEVCNRRAMELLDLPPDLMASRPPFAQVLAYQWATDEFVNEPPDVQELVRGGVFLERPHSYDRQRPSGRIIEIQSMPLEGGGMVRTYADITERRNNEERIRHLARHDGLTALVNRDVFLEQLQSAAAGSRGPDEVFAVHFIDLDNFKPINDRFGHAIGDKVLALAAQRMRQFADASDVVARLGGDEFAVLQHRVKGQTDALRFAERLLEEIRQPMQIEAHALELCASIGIALSPACGGDADMLLRAADTAMYLAKASGRDRVRLFPD